MYYKNLSDPWKEYFDLRLERLREIEEHCNDVDGSLQGACLSFGGPMFADTNPFYEKYGVKFKHVRDTIGNIVTMLDEVKDSRASLDVPFFTKLEPALEYLQELREGLRYWQGQLKRASEGEPCHERARDHIDDKKAIVDGFLEEVVATLQELVGEERYSKKKNYSVRELEAIDRHLVSRSRDEMLEILERQELPIMQSICAMQRIIEATHDECL